MKIFLNDKVYVSIHDIQFLRRNKIDIPVSILKECIDYMSKTNYKNEKSEHAFIVLNSVEAIDFFAKQEQIIDYDEFKYFTTKCIRNLSLKLYVMAAEAERDYKSLEISVINNKGKLAKLQAESEYYYHIAYSLQEIIKYRNKEFKLPMQDKYLEHKEFLIKIFESGRNEAMDEKTFWR